MDPRNNPWFFLSVLFLFFSSKTHLTIAADTISVGESLTGNQTIVSKDENFELGFFRPGKSLNYYIGIWYKKVTTQTVVWVANRDKPLLDPSTSELRLLGNGNLVLFNQSKTPIWSTNSPSNTLNSTEAFLGDDGNLVLRDGSNPSAVIWQSFDYPTNTWLPGGKLAFNKRTNQSQLLTSWRNEEDPAPGIFSLELDPRGTSQYLIKWNGSQQVWTSGEWNGQTFNLVPEMRLNYIYNFSYVTNENESYFTYTVYNSSIVSRFVMDLSGQIKQLTWAEKTQMWNLFWSQPKQQCDVYGICGPFGSCNQDTLKCECLPGFEKRFPKDWDLNDPTGGCVRETPLQCGRKDGFSRRSNMKMPANPQVLSDRSAEACEAACADRCSCNAYAYGSSGCSIWDGDLLNPQQQSNDGGDLYLRLAASAIRIPEGKTKKKSITGAVVGAIVGVVAFLVLALVLIWRWRVRRSVGTSKTVEGNLVAFTYRDMQNATKNFSQKLGGGGFGSVFKGVLPDSTAIAVKKLEGLSQGEKQFRSEVSTIGTIQHVNLVRLRGFCSEGTKRLLVYDFMSKGSLDSNLFHPKDTVILDWKTRYQIALGTARGLVYLHEKCRDCIIHCDIKPENILLDAEFCPKVADFGLAKLVGREFSRVLTTMRGTRGYLAPEWISGVAITAKADVYSYGMMLFEIISGRRNSEHYSNDEKIRFFPTWAATKMNEGEEIISLVDNRLEGNVDIEELTRACRVACWCIQDDEAHRPTMGQVVQILEGVLEVNTPPIPRSLHVLVENQDKVFFFSESSNRSSQAQSNTTSSTSSQAKSTASSMSSKS
ncbi:Protein kinase domain [Macleaya cordata]|uniref:Receptor-like serine/threonine-protein kinase n=1 Tax=Macleaya cordata TaxID=56857 RepID=A0A200Q8J1_MACCD|nr:Protein kinase domain [Macleaya cordata]OVA13182.1 Protein kinase domain [Macleaya cordata]